MHECGEPLCHRVIPMSDQYCKQHAGKHQRQWRDTKLAYRKSKLAQAIKRQEQSKYDHFERDADATAFYASASWRQVRDYVYARDGATCQACGEMLTDRKIVDHIVPRRLTTKMQALNTTGLWTLCYRCHYRKTKLEQAIASQSGGDTKLRHLDREWWTKVLNEQKGQTK